MQNQRKCSLMFSPVAKQINKSRRLRELRRYLRTKMLPIRVAGRQKTMTRMSAMAFVCEREWECKFYFKLMGLVWGM